MPVAPSGPMIGIKPGFDGGLPEGAEAAFQLIALAPDLTPVPMEVTWELNRVTTRYQWYSTYGNWNWEPTVSRERRRLRRRDARRRDPVTVSAPTDWGRYELVVTGQDGGFVSSSVGFSAGWYAPADAATTPDMLEVSLDAERYAPGDTATLRFVPRTAGKALVTVVSNRLIDMVAVDAVAGENTVDPAGDRRLGRGGLRDRHADPAARRRRRGTIRPGRWASPMPRSIPARMRSRPASTCPPKPTPRGPMEVVLNVDGIAEGETAYATIAAVDVGILNLTSFAAPDPSDHYFGQRRLGMSLRDLYGRLIDGRTGAMGTIRSGGDAMASMRMQAPPPTEELMAQFSGPDRSARTGRLGPHSTCRSSTAPSG